MPFMTVQCFSYRCVGASPAGIGVSIFAEHGRGYGGEGSPDTRGSKGTYSPLALR